MFITANAKAILSKEASVGLILNSVHISLMRTFHRHLVNKNSNNRYVNCLAIGWLFKDKHSFPLNSQSKVCNDDALYQELSADQKNAKLTQVFFRRNATGIGHLMFVRSFVQHEISSSNISKTV